MVGNRLTITLTPDQQKQIQEATGRNVAELHFDLAATGELSEADLDQVSGGSGGDRPTESISLNFTKIQF
jgi:hypothetical protein